MTKFIKTLIIINGIIIPLVFIAILVTFVGNLIKLGAVITDAVLTADPVVTTNLCKDSCTLCIDSCPVGAIGLNKEISQKKCREFSEVNNKRGIEIYACHACRSVCPNRNGK